MFDILSIIPGKKRHSPSGWYSFNAVCCHHRGHRADKRMRGGLKNEGSIQRYNCFNCGYSCYFEPGKTIHGKTRQLLEWCGVDQEQIQRWNLESLQNRDLVELVTEYKKPIQISFEQTDLPDGAELIDVNNPKHKKFVDYLYSRGASPAEYPYMVTPYDRARNSNRIIIPFTYKNQIVGYTSRYFDGKIPKYINNMQPGYLFGIDLQKSNWQVVLLVEGIFDAIAVDGCALSHSEISVQQAEQLRSLRRKVILVPDQDATGLEVCEQALSLGYSVSIPPWASYIKDPADAVKQYGKFPTILSILRHATMSRIKIEMRKKQILKGK